MFIQRKRHVEGVRRGLQSRGLPAVSIHGDKGQSERERALGAFRSGAVPVLLATDVASRGLDIPHVGLVVQYDLPNTIEDYVHRIGRTGRVGNQGTALGFFTPTQDASLAGELATVLREAQQEVPPFLARLVEAKAASRRYGRRGSGGSRGGGSPTGEGYGAFPQSPHPGRYYGGKPYAPPVYATGTPGYAPSGVYYGPGTTRGPASGYAERAGEYGYRAYPHEANPAPGSTAAMYSAQPYYQFPSQN